MAVSAPVEGSSVTAQVRGPPLGLADANNQTGGTEARLGAPDGDTEALVGTRDAAEHHLAVDTAHVHAPAPPLGFVDLMTLPL